MSCIHSCIEQGTLRREGFERALLQRACIEAMGDMVRELFLIKSYPYIASVPKVSNKDNDKVSMPHITSCIQCSPSPWAREVSCAHPRRNLLVVHILICP